MKKILRPVGMCCFGAALMFGDVCGVQQIGLLNPEVMQSALFKLVREIEGNTNRILSTEEKIKRWVKPFEYSLVLTAQGPVSVEEVNGFVLAVFRGAGGLINSSELGDDSIPILEFVCHSVSRKLTALDAHSALHPDVFVGILESAWGNPELMRIAELVMIAAGERVRNNSRIFDSGNADFCLTEYLRTLFFKNPSKYNAVIMAWIEENRSKDWHWKWKKLLELPILNKPEVVEPLIPLLKRGTEISIISLVEFLNFGYHRFDWKWQDFLNSPEHFIELLESAWGNAELMENAGLLVVDAEQKVHGLPRFEREDNDGFYLIKYLQPLILGNPDKYDAAVRAWIEENRSKNWHWKWRNFLELPILNKPEIIEPLRAFLRKIYYTDQWRFVAEPFRTEGPNAINNVASLVEFLNFGYYSFDYDWQRFLNSPKYFFELLESARGNPELVENAGLLVADAEQKVHGLTKFGGEYNDVFYLVKYLRSLILKNPGKYDVAIGEWVERNRSEDWQWKLRSFLELPILNGPEIIEPLRAFLRKIYVEGKWFLIELHRTKKLNAINEITSLSEFLDYLGNSSD
jgi:hypothetical protein